MFRFNVKFSEHNRLCLGGHIPATGDLCALVPFCARRRHITVLAGIALLAATLPVGVAASVGSAAASAASPTVSGPVTGGSGAILPPNLNGFDLAQVGYQQSEFFLTGTANAYTRPDR